MKPFQAVTLAPISVEQLRAYAEASGDPNLIHLDKEVAKKAGLPGIIAHGMLVAGFLAEQARAYGAGLTLTQFQVRFRGMTLLGESLVISGMVKADADGTVMLDLIAANVEGEIKATGKARLGST